MIRRELEENELIDDFFRVDKRSPEALLEFLSSNLVHPGLCAEFGHRVVKNLVGVTYRFFEGLGEGKNVTFSRFLYTWFIWHSR